MKQHIDGQKAQLGRFASSPAYEDIAVPVWNTLSPRTSVVYDVFGNGKTAIRGGFNKFVTAATTGFAQLYNPTGSTTQTLPWTDVNGDDMAQGERGCAYLTSGCEINFLTLPANFGVRSLARFDPELKRPHQLAFNVGVSHEILPGFAVTAEYFRSSFKNMIARNNVALSVSDYTPVSIYNPMTGGTVTAYNLSTAKASAVDLLDSNDADLERRYDGLELNFNAKLPGGARLFGGTSTERTVSNACRAFAIDAVVMGTTRRALASRYSNESWGRCLLRVFQLLRATSSGDPGTGGTSVVPWAISFLSCLRSLRVGCNSFK